MFNDFQKEQFNRETIQTDKGFITYEVCEDNSIYIHILYVKPNSRGKFYGKVLEDMVIERHKPWALFCYVDLTSNCPEKSLATILKAGYSIYQSEPHKITLAKQLKDK